jgi:hypothetical protein
VSEITLSVFVLRTSFQHQDIQTSLGQFFGHHGPAAARADDDDVTHLPFSCCGNSRETRFVRPPPRNNWTDPSQLADL